MAKPTKDKIVTVNVSLAPRYKQKYAVLCDRTLEQIVAYAATNPGVFIFPFGTKQVLDVPDMRALMKPPLVDLYGDWIVKPMYIGNCRPIGDAIDRIIRASFGQFFADSECILMEWEED